MRVDLIIAHHGANRQLDALALACLRSIRRYTLPGAYRLLWIDNGSPVPSPKIEAELAQHADKVILKNNSNVGFVKATNMGLRLSDAPYAVLLNNDTEVPLGWLEKLRAPLKGKVGLSGPRTNTRGSWQGRYRPGNDTVILPRGHMLAFFAVMITRQVLETVGCLDEDFGPGLGDDDNFCERAERAGFQLAFVGGLTVKHNHRSTFKALYTEAQIAQMQEEALKLFHRKKSRSSV